jgi:DNA invertase Pin-like site-specific DNA recombinase
MCNFIAYYRVSTKKQGKSGLGLDSQKEIVQNYLKDCDELIAEFTEIESGRKDSRVELSNAINLAKRNNATLLIAKLDRFSRRVSFIASMMESGIKFVVAELPSASDFQLHIHAAIAQEERRLISERTKTALDQAKKRGV